MRSKSKSFKQDKWVVIMATSGILLLSIVCVLVVRAYLSAKSGQKTNEFAPMTYTDTQIEEPVTSFEVTNPTGTRQTISKHATISNPASAQKKPVFVRAAVTVAVYDPNGVNVAYKYPGVSVAFAPAEGWTAITDATDGVTYYYYNQIVDPGEATTDLLGTGDNNVTITAPYALLPDGYEIKINVIADTVQAVSSDSAKDEYRLSYDAEALKAWNVNATLGKTEGKPNGSVTWTAKSS